MLVVAILLISVGVITCMLGTKLFKLLLPLLGLVTGFLVGYTGFQGLFGTSAVSTAMSVVIALAVGLVMAVLAYIFFDMAILFLTIAVGATAFSYLGVTLGLRQEGFLVFMLAIAGGVLAGLSATKYDLGLSLVMTITALLGTAYILTGLLLVSGDVTVREVTDSGIVSTMLRVVDQSFLWLLVWIGGSLISVQLQKRLLLTNYGSDAFMYTENK